MAAGDARQAFAAIGITGGLVFMMPIYATVRSVASHELPQFAQTLRTTAKKRGRAAIRCAAWGRQTDYTPRMVIDSPASEHCAVCAAETGEAGAFCHFYLEGRRVALCGAICAEHFMRGSRSPDGAAGPGGFLEELAQKQSWAFWR